MVYTLYVMYQYTMNRTLYSQSVIPCCIGHLHTMANQFFIDGLATSTRSTYNDGQRKFINFCTATKLHSVPASEATLVLFATHLEKGNILHVTIKVYLAAVRHIHVSTGLHEFFNSQLIPRLQLVLIGIKKCQALTHSPRVCLPITLQIMYKIKEVLSQEPQSYKNIMLWAACCIAFLGSCLRVYNSRSRWLWCVFLFIPLRYLSWQPDKFLSFESDLKTVKTNPFWRGVNIYLGATDRLICPVLGILPYLAAQRNWAGPLFVTDVGKALDSLNLLKIAELPTI